MKYSSTPLQRRCLHHRGFTLIELTVVIAIIGMLVVLMIPEFGKIQARAQSVTCVNNLRQVGVGVLTYAGEHDNTYPLIEPNETDPVYKPDENGEVQAEPMLDVLEPYGVTSGVLKCPTDVRAGANSYFNKVGSSYQWRITVDGENVTAPMIYGGRRGYGVRLAKPSRVTICTDYSGIHSGRMNRVYADGHVSKPF